MKAHFYCTNLTGHPGFSIDEWNEAFLELEKTNLSEKQKSEILNPPACKTQCFECMSIVGRRQAQTRQALSSK